MTVQHHILPLIEAHYENMTHLEQGIADYFLTNFPSQVAAAHLTKELHVSHASLTRFAQKCGFAGYREFSYENLRHLQEQDKQFASLHHGLTKRVLSDYDEMLSKTYALVDEAQIERISQRLETARQVYFYGQGSSGMVAQEMKLRFMRLGLTCEAVTDDHMLKWMDNLLDPNCLVIGHSLSGKTSSVMEALKKAHEKGAHTVLMTTQDLDEMGFIDEVLLVASARNLSYGNRISPQFPLLIAADLLYAYFMANNKEEKEERFKRTIINNQ